MNYLRWSSLAFILLWCYEVKSIFQHVDNAETHERKLKKLTEKICPGKGDKFDVALNDFKKCSRRIDEESDLSLCETIEKNLEECTKGVVSFYESCLPEKSKDLPKFFIDMMESIYKELCDKMNGEHIIELTNPCLNDRNTHTEQCVREYKQHYTSVMRELAKNEPTKILICGAASDMRPCILRHVNASCEATVTRESFAEIYDAVFEPCGENYLKQSK